MKKLKTFESFIETKNKIRLCDIYDEYPEEDELLWDFVGSMDYKQHYFDVVIVNPVEIFKTWKVDDSTTIERSLVYATKDQKKQINYYENHLEEIKNEYIVVSLEDKILIDGYHRIVALAINNVKEIKAININS